MCGIVGVINGSNKIKTGLGRVFHEMLWADQLRGVDGAGVFWYNNKRDHYEVVKNADTSEVLDDKDFEKAKRDIELMPFMVGHNRSATRGSVSSENNHPFDEGNVVLVHNGTMNYIPKEYDNGTKVDSHAIAKMLHKASPSEFIKSSFGAYALVWFDKEARTLQLMRNKDRPLWLIQYEDFSLISSEAGLAVWIASRNGFAYKEPPLMLKEHHLYTFQQYDHTKPTIQDLSHMKSFNHGYCDEDYTETNYRPRRGNVVPFHQRVQHHSRGSSVSTDLVGRQDTTQEEFDKINVFAYWDRICNEHNRGKNVPSTPIVVERTTVTKSDNKASTPIKLKKGEKIKFSIDTAVMANDHVEIIGNLANVPVSAYSVRAHVNKALSDVSGSMNLWEGVISEIQVNAKDPSKVTVWVKKARETGESDPQLFLESQRSFHLVPKVEEQTEKK